MSWFTRIFRRRNLYRDLADEMREHLEEKTEQFMREMSLKKPSRGAAGLRECDGDRERGRESWQWPRLESIWADVRFALRQLRKSPGFTITAIVDAGSRHRGEHSRFQRDECRAAAFSGSG